MNYGEHECKGAGVSGCLGGGDDGFGGVRIRGTVRLVALTRIDASVRPSSVREVIDMENTTVKARLFLVAAAAATTAMAVYAFAAPYHASN